MLSSWHFPPRSYLFALYYNPGIAKTQEKCRLRICPAVWCYIRSKRAAFCPAHHKCAGIICLFYRQSQRWLPIYSTPGYRNHYGAVLYWFKESYKNAKEADWKQVFSNLSQKRIIELGDIVQGVRKGKSTLTNGPCAFIFKAKIEARGSSVSFCREAAFAGAEREHRRSGKV